MNDEISNALREVEKATTGDRISRTAAKALAAEVHRLQERERSLMRERDVLEFERDELAQAARELRRHDMDADPTGHRTALYRALDELDGTISTACCPHEPTQTGTFTR